MVDERLINIENYKNLANAIIKCAAEDYVACYGVESSQAKYSATTLERFFRGEEFLLFTGGNVDPEYIIERLRYKARKKIRTKGKIITRT